MKVLIAKPGLDGHDRGAKVIARAFEEAGAEVIYTGLQATVSEIAEIVEKEEVDVVGVSLLSGAHNTLMPKIIDSIKEKGIDDVVYLLGGIIPQQDISNLKAMGGLMHLAGQADGPPTWLGVAVGDVVTGIQAAYAALLGYIKALKTGEGEFIDVSMYDCMVALGERAHSQYIFTGNVVNRGPDKNMAPWGPFKAKDGYVALIVPTEKMWARLCKAIGREDFIENENFNSGPKRAQYREEWEPALIEWMSDKTKEEVCEILMSQGMPCGPVQDSKDVLNCPHLEKRDLFVKIPDKIMDKLTVIGSPLKMENSEPTYGAEPLLGEHTDQVLKELLNYDDAKVKALHLEIFIKTDKKTRTTK